MAYAISLPARWRSQPRYPWRSEPTGPFAQGLQMLHVFGASQTMSLLNLVSRKVYSGSGTGIYGADSYGTFYEATSASTRLKFTGVADVESFTWAGNHSFFVTFSRRSTVAAWAGIIGLYNSAGSRYQGLQRESTNAVMRIWQNNDPQTVAYDVTTATSIDLLHTILVTSDSTTSRLYSSVGTGPAGVAQTALGSYTLSTIEIGGWSSGETLPARYRAFGRWNRALTSSEALAFVRNPWQVFSQATPRMYSFPVVVTAPTLSAAKVISVGSTTATPQVYLDFP